MTWKIINGNNTEVLKQYPDNSFDAVVTDPPYGISFLGKDWDSKKATETTSKLTALHNLPSGMKHTSLADDLEFQKWMSEVFSECIRVLKPGGHLLAFSAARTYHHMAMAAQFAGFEIRDQIMWIYGSGFPKSQDVGKAMDRRAGKADTKTSLLQAKEILKTLYSNSGKTTTQINSECGFNATGYLATEGKHKGWAQNLPLNEKWQKIKEVVGCDDTYDYLFTSVEREIVGTKQSGCFSDEERHTIGASETQTVDITIPKSNSARQWDGWGTQLKPAHEPIVMARKPIKNTVMDNVQEYGTGAINIDATRVGDEEITTIGGWSEGHDWNSRTTYNKINTTHQGRFPANVIHDGSDEVVSLFPNSNGSGGSTPNTKVTGYGKLGGGSSTYTPNDRTTHNSGSGSAARFFYCPKVSGKERHIGCDNPGAQTRRARDEDGNVLPYAEKIDGISPTMLAERLKDSPGNNHPTVKPIELMKYLIKLVTPMNGHVLDPFNGSGSTGCAAVELGYNYTGIELDPNYVEIANKRISHWESECVPKTTYNELFNEV